MITDSNARLLKDGSGLEELGDCFDGRLIISSPSAYREGADGLKLFGFRLKGESEQVYAEEVAFLRSTANT